MQKIVLEVTLSSNKSSTSILTIVAKLDGVKSMKLDEKKNRLTVVGDVDPVSIVEAIRKKKKHAKIVSVGPADPDQRDLSGYNPYYNWNSTYRPVHPSNLSEPYRPVPCSSISYDEQPTGCVIA
ncbi:Heavy metal transport/detoxification superfamily protein [Rhynchospora pubera]|uniref:Heavy metal transport/detoxification superfamily protein n=1 Tax=Rhynchospora pubera TaxID=906938 RepID=A0AAV8GXT0_9POAL|nr:Heavy metal transport/detoxification superfamily protein [Rhynchospora pubera]